jgi:hypothetical protein
MVTSLLVPRRDRGVSLNCRLPHRTTRGGGLRNRTGCPPRWFFENQHSGSGATGPCLSRRFPRTACNRFVITPGWRSSTPVIDTLRPQTTLPAPARTACPRFQPPLNVADPSAGCANCSPQSSGCPRGFGEIRRVSRGLVRKDVPGRRPTADGRTSVTGRTRRRGGRTGSSCRGSTG